jgi:hypothetical protein
MIKFDTYTWESWCVIWEAQSDQGLTDWRFRLYDFDAPVGSPERRFVKRALGEIARISRRRGLHSILREQMMTARPDISGDILIEALVEVETLRLDLGGPGSFESDFTAALEIAEARAATTREERNGQ